MPAQFNDWRFTALSPLPGWALALCAALALASVALAGWGLRREQRASRRAVLLALRALSAALALALVLEPGLELLATSKVRARVALLVDTSRSMKLPASPGGPSRAEEAARPFANAAELSALAKRFQLDAFTFDSQSRPTTELALGDVAGAAARSTGARTDLLAAIAGAASGGGGRPLAGIVVATDGADNVDLRGGLNPEARDALKKLGAPVLPLSVGTGALKDLAVEDVRVDDFAFVRNNLDLEVTVAARGFPTTQVPLTLKREGRLVAQATVTVGGGVPSAKAKLSFVPDETGKFAFTVSAPVYEGEAVAENNQKSFVLKVIRDRVRVLLVVGRPSWDERFLRQLLKKDPNVDLISFFILRTPSDEANASQEDLSLIPFPTEEIFREQLKTFDLVIFQNFGYRPYHMAQYLPGIAEYVEGGGAFAMLGGEQSFSLGDYGGTPIEEILPVTLLPTAAPGSTAELVAPRLTDAGARHPLTRLVPSATANAGVWSALPKLPGHNLTAGAKAGAQVLLDDPAHGGAPVLAVGQFGRGRSMALTSDSTWYWSLVAAGAGQGARAYETFWHNAIRWLVRDPAFTPVKLTSERDVFEAGEPVSLDAQARTTDYGAAAGAGVKVELFSAEDGHLLQFPDAVAGADGDARLSLENVPPGAYNAVATFDLKHSGGEVPRAAGGGSATALPAGGGGEVPRANAAFVVEAGGPELTDAAPRPELLEQIADATGGEVHAADTAKLSQLPFRDPRRVEIGQRQSKPLWDQLWAILALSGVLGAEWTLRRRWGYA